jgi:SAM-dependent methyltransferase
MITIDRPAAPVSSRCPQENSIQLQCPHCGAGLISVDAKPEPDPDHSFHTRQCSDCQCYIFCQNGIWRALHDGRTAHFGRFITDYEFIRAAEGRGSDASDYYLALPYRDISGRNADQWSIRSRTFRYIEQRILSRFATQRGRKLRILDLGAGNGWMSYRLALAGHMPVAVDLLTNDQDGLGAAAHFRSRLPSLFLRVQAELDHLPFADDAFDLVIFNASFHYSEDYVTTFAEALRCTRPGGLIVIADTPWYSRDESGRKMVNERRAHFIARYGFASDAIPSREYLTDHDLELLRDRFAIEWRLYTPYYGVRWSLRPLLAKLQRRREPSRFRIHVAEVRG